MEERSAFALLVGSVVDATTLPAPFSPLPPRTPIAIEFDGIGTPPVATDAIVARAYSAGGFVLAFDSGDVTVDNPSSSGPSPKHLVGAFDIHFTISAEGYADLPSTYSCHNDALPIAPAAYVLQPNPIAIQGYVSFGGVAVAGATVQITAESPPAALPPATTTDANGMYTLGSVPAAQTVTISAAGGGGSTVQTISLDYPGSVVTVNLPLS
ncbi:MAG: carboxypeptidase-like regulatory domain-containing protein [Candidatus Lustribacter sp.]|jgi:hypothetical protein